MGKLVPKNVSNGRKESLHKEECELTLRKEPKGRRASRQGKMREKD